MSKTPLVSVITVVFNGEKHLQQTIDSVRNQTYTNIEYIIVDGGSTDSTINIIIKNQNTISKWVSESDKGLYDAMNKGIEMSSGDLVGTINSDDWYEPNAISTIVKAYKQYPNKKIFHGDIQCINIDNSFATKKAKTSPFLIKYYGMVLNHPSMFIHKDIYKKHSYNVGLSSVADYQLILENYLKNKHNFQYIPQIISNFRLGGISGSLSLVDSLRENYLARTTAGMSKIEALFGIFFRLLVEFYKAIK